MSPPRVDDIRREERYRMKVDIMWGTQKIFYLAFTLALAARVVAMFQGHG